MFEHVMVDLETFSTADNAAIVSIGATKFNPQLSGRECIIDSFDVQIDPKECQLFGMDVDVDTILWWMSSERDDAREELLNHVNGRVDLRGALNAFHDWFGHESLPVWGNGAAFDNVILRNAYRTANMQVPWNFWHDRCYRTLKALAPDIKIERYGTYHSALDDAISQTLHLTRVADRLGIVL